MLSISRSVRLMSVPWYLCCSCPNCYSLLPTVHCGPVPSTHTRNVDKYADARPPHPQIVAVRLDAPLFFANTLHFEHTIKEHLAAAEAGAASSECWGG
jgi:hypothetical protein